MNPESPAYQLCHTAHVCDIVPAGQQVMTFGSHDTVETVVRKLAERSVLSAPVIDSKTKQIIGFVDVLDVLAHVVRAAPNGKELAANNLKALEMAGRNLALEEVHYVVNASGRDAAVTVHAKAPLTELVQLFAKGVHRVAVTADAGVDSPISAVVSQSSFVSWISPHLREGKLKELGNKSIATLSLVTGKVVGVAQDAPVISLLSTLNKSGCGAVAVVDRDGKLAGNFSAADVRGLFQEKFPSFLAEVQVYLQDHAPASLQPTVVRPDHTLDSVVKSIVEQKVHRVWVIDAEYRPIGVITLTDIVKLILNFQYSPKVH